MFSEWMLGDGVWMSSGKGPKAPRDLYYFATGNHYIHSESQHQVNQNISLNGPLPSLGVVVVSDDISCTGCGSGGGGGGEACRETSELREYLFVLCQQWCSATRLRG
jgi:hypothetical protein